MRRMNFKKNRADFCRRIRRADELFKNDHFALSAVWFPQKDAWADGIIDAVEKAIKSAGLEKAIMLLIGFTAGYLGHMIWVIINK